MVEFPRVIGVTAATGFRARFEGWPPWQRVDTHHASAIDRPDDRIQAFVKAE